MAEYKSIERRILESEPVKGLGRFTYNLGRHAYGAVVTPFRFPTFVRKCVNRQASGEPINGVAGIFGALSGIFSGLVADFAGLTYSFNEATKENYVPLAVLGATNLASLMFELGRLPKSRQEYRELKGRK